MDIRHQLSELKKEVESYENVPKVEEYWRGAELYIIRSIEDIANKEDRKTLYYEGHTPFFLEMNYYSRRLLITEYAKEISWLFTKIVDIFSEVDALTPSAARMEFYGSLANIANKYIRSLKITDLKEICYCIIHEANALNDMINDNEFYYLTIASGGIILDDLDIEENDKNFISIEESKNILGGKE